MPWWTPTWIAWIGTEITFSKVLFGGLELEGFLPDRYPPLPSLGCPVRALHFSRSGLVENDIIACPTCTAWWRYGEVPWHMAGCPTQDRGVDYPVLDELSPMTMDVDGT